MKAIADEDESIFSQIPKQTLTELLVKLLNPASSHGGSSGNEVKLSASSIETLITTLTPSKPKSQSSIINSTTSATLDESSSNLHIDEFSKHQRSMSHMENNNKRSKYDSDYEDELNSSITATLTSKHHHNHHNHNHDSTLADVEEDDYDYDNELVIEGNIGEIPYRLYEIDVDPSDLWQRPPKEPGFNPATLLTQLSSSSDTINNNSDQECDPRIKYYSNRTNAVIIYFYKYILFGGS